MTMRFHGVAGLTLMGAGLGLVSPVSCGEPGSALGVTDSGADGTTGLHDAAGDATGPVISNVVVTPNPNSVLSATVTFTTNVPTTASAAFQNTSPGNLGNVLTSPPSTAPTTSHSIHLIGMRASSRFDVTLTATTTSGVTGTATTTWQTAPLPLFLPRIVTLVNDTTKTAKGWTLMTVWAWSGTGPAGISPAESSTIIVDSEFQIVWYEFLPTSVTADGITTAATKLPNGDIAFLVGENGWVEIDMMGSVVQDHFVTELGLHDLNHELSQEPSGNFLSLSTVLKSVSGFPDGGGPTTLNVVGDAITELGRDGGVLNQWSEFDMLSPYHEGTPNQFNAGYWNSLYPGVDGGTKDWTHDNAASVDVNDGNVIVSSRTQSWIYKFEPVPGGPPKLLWAMGPKGDFTLAGASWMSSQHAAYAIPGTDHIMCFDDGNERLLNGHLCGFSPGLTPCYSRAVEFALDVPKKTATIAWEYVGDSPFYSFDLGSSYVLSNDDVLVNAGGEVCRGPCGGAPGPDQYSGAEQSSADEKHADIFEVTHTIPPATIAHFEVKMPFESFPTDRSFSGMSVYRAVRIPSIY